jgi:hypothetical protein
VPSDKVRPYLAFDVGFTDNEFQARTYRVIRFWPGVH